MTKSFCIIAGTRPEVIKLAVLYHELKSRPDVIVTFCAIGQHQELLDHTLSSFHIQPTLTLLQQVGARSLDTLAASVLKDLSEALVTLKPNYVIVQGDTTTAAASTLAAFYNRIPVAHVEAGLRTHDLNQPWPEEGHRRIISQLADIHFAPTGQCVDNLLREGLSRGRIFEVGNTGIDALKFIKDQGPPLPNNVALMLREVRDKKLIVVSFHRREGSLVGFSGVVKALSILARRSDIHLVVEEHPNPEVVKALAALAHSSAITIIESMPYPYFVQLLSRAHLILTDSGGIQEEAPSLGIPVLVLREKTERVEAVMLNSAKLIGLSTQMIVDTTTELLDNIVAYKEMAVVRNIYGTGESSRLIADVLLRLS